LHSILPTKYHFNLFQLILGMVISKWAVQNAVTHKGKNHI
jgi:hypothetical protein